MHLTAPSSCPVNLDHIKNVLPTDGTDVDLACAGDARADMTTVVEERILLLAVADLAQVHLLVSHLPVADAAAVALAIFISSDVFVAGLLLDKCTLAMALVLEPVTVISIPRGILHETTTVTFAKDEVAVVRRTQIGNVHALSVEVTLLELAAVVIACKGGVDGLVTGECLGWVVARLGP